MIARFGKDGVRLDLEPREFAFVDLVLSYVLHGVRLPDHDFLNILGMSRLAAEALYSELQSTEAAARAQGQHWLGAPVREQEGDF